MTETRILEINLISAQGLKIPPSTKTHRMHTYAITWVHPSSKLRTHLDLLGANNPTWNEKFLFRVPPSFIYADTSAVQVHIYASGYIRDYLIGSVRFLLSSTSLVNPKTGAVIGTPAFSAVHIRRPSGRVHGVLNIAATVYESLDFPAFDGMSAVCFRDLIGEKENENTTTTNNNNNNDISNNNTNTNNNNNNKRRRERRMSWHPNFNRVSSKRSEEKTTSLSEDLVEFSDGNDSTTSSSSSVTTTMFKELNGEVGGKKGVRSDGGGMWCGLLLHRRFSFCPSDQNLLALAGFHGKQI